MSHTVSQKAKLLSRVRCIRGQIEALERALEAEKECSEIMHQIAAMRGATNGLMLEVIEDHIQSPSSIPTSPAKRERAQEVQERTAVLRTYLK